MSRNSSSRAVSLPSRARRSRRVTSTFGSGVSNPVSSSCRSVLERPALAAPASELSDLESFEPELLESGLPVFDVLASEVCPSDISPFDTSEPGECFPDPFSKCEPGELAFSPPSWCSGLDRDMVAVMMAKQRMEKRFWCPHPAFGDAARFRWAGEPPLGAAPSAYSNAADTSPQRIFS